jgi:lysine 2,3-aminomutase
MEQWQQILASSVTRPEEIAGRYPISTRALEEVVGRFPMRITPYYLGLIEEPGDPIWRQCIPDVRELEDDRLSCDPLNEKGFSPVSGLIHRYPDRAVWLVSSMCATFCRFCMRKHQVGWGKPNPNGSDDNVLNYIEKTPAIRDVILSGGDPLLLSDDILENLLTGLRRISHVEIVRIHTRVPVVLPERITPKLCRLLKQAHPLFINTHFNHPAEITTQSAEACSKLADAGIPLGNQTVLLKGVNDDPLVMKTLMQRLLSVRVRPYYIHQADLVQGTRHFHVSVDRGLEILSGLRGHTTGLAVPYYMIDLPGGKGKVPVLPEGVQRRGDSLLLRNYLGEVVEYPDPDLNVQSSMANDH